MTMTPPVELAAWLACASFVLVLINQAAKAKQNLFGRDKHSTEITPQPLEIRQVDGMVRERDCKERHSSVEARIANLERVRVEDAKLASESRKTLYAHIDKVRDLLSTEINQMPSQIITILKNTGAIK